MTTPAPTDRATSPELTAINRATVGIGLYAGAFGLTFGAVAVAAGFTIFQALVLSVVMFTGASQFAFVGVVSGGGSPFAAIPAALLLGVRNAFYGVPITSILRPRGARRFLAAHFVIDETTAMATAQQTSDTRRYAFWLSGVVLFVLWVTGSLVGAVLGAALDARALGLDAAAPAVFLALLWPQLKSGDTVVLALLGAAVAMMLIPLAPAGVPVIAAAVVAVVFGLRGGAGVPSDDTGQP